MRKIKILHTADMQYKDRDQSKSLNSYIKSSQEIESIIKEKDIDVYLFAGDILEYDNPTDAERNLMYQHFGRVLSITNLKEFVVMNGNHDIKLGKNIELSQIGNNPLNTFVDSIRYINPEYHNKLTYLKLQKNYKSKLTDKLGYLSYSLEDGKSTGNNLDVESLKDDLSNQYTIPIFHDILYQYAIDKKLPVSQSKLNNLMRLENFICNVKQDTLILAGDIHENWQIKNNYETTGNLHFIYPGSPVQRNHGEGTYCYITSKGPNFKPADVKVVKYIELNLDEDNPDNTTYTVEDIKLSNTLSYIKFDFNSLFVEDWKEQLSVHFNNLINNGILSDTQNLIKIELSNVYMNFENEIITLITEFFINQNLIFNIDIVYGQVFFEASEEQLNIQKILKENSTPKQTVEYDSEGNEIEEDLISHEETYDFDSSEEIALNQEQLKLVFNSLIESLSNHIRKEFTSENEYQVVIKELESLFSQQLDISYGNKRSYNIEFIDIETTGFMALGENKINLDIPGLTRIIGNNGIGKTTLYNMLRWVIKGTVLENLPKNTKRENLLLIFNDKQIEQDTIKVKLNLKINGTKVSIYRFASRTWKATATEKDKLSLQWRKYIDTVSSSLLLKIYKDNENPLEQKDNEAQQSLDIWFGNTIDNIFIINQFKLMSLLNQNGDTLKETILNYIGVDYLQSLQNNLEAVKQQYTINKPSKSQADIVTEKTELQKTLEDIDDNISQLQINIETETNNITNIKNDITSKVGELVNIGNIPAEINTLESEIKIYKDEIINFQPKTKKPLPELTLVKPVIDTELVNNIEQELSKAKISLDDFKKKMNDYVLEFNHLKDKVTDKLQNLVEETKHNKLKLINSLTTQYDIDIKNCQENIDDILKYLEKEFKTRIDNFISKIKTSIDNTELTKNNLERNIYDIESEVKSLQEKLSSSFCNSCNRPIELSQTDIDNLNKELSYQKSILENHNIELSNTKKILQDLKNKLVEDEKYRLTVENKLKDILTFKTDDILVIEDNVKFIFENKHLRKILSESDKFESLNYHYNKYSQILTDKNKLSDNPQIKELEENEIKYFSLYKSVLTYSIDKLTKETLIDNPNSSIIAMNNIWEDYSKQSTILSIQEENYKQEELKFNQLKNDNQKLLDDYNQKLIEYYKSVEEINTYNSEVDMHNSGIKTTETKLELAQSKLEDINSKKLLDTYNQLLKEKIDLEDKLSHTESILNVCNTNLNNLINTKNNSDEKLNVLNGLVNDWIEYRKKTFIYKTFEKLIKDDFKQAIFNYYRNYLNNKLNILLEGLNFRLFWNSDSNLYMVEVDSKSGEMIYRPVKLSSGMQTAFLGLSLIYCFHLLNIRNSISHIFIDEISGQLNSGKNVKGESSSETKNYQQQLVLLLSKFDKKNVFIIDHVIDNLYETYSYNVVRDNGLTVYQ